MLRVSTAFFAKKNPLIAKNKGTAVLSTSRIATVMSCESPKCSGSLKVCIPTTKIIATPRRKSKYGLYDEWEVMILFNNLLFFYPSILTVQMLALRWLYFEI